MTEQEFRHIAQDCSGRLKALAKRFCRAADLAIDEDDLVQEALLAFWNLSEKGYPVRNAEALLVKITKNICISHLRRRHIVTGPIDNDVFPGGVPATERLDIQDAAALHKEMYGSLTPSELEYTRMREETGWSLDEMSANTGKDKSVIKSLLSKARRKMKEVLKEQ